MLADINGNLTDLRSEAAMASQRFCLRWNNHQSNLLSVFDQLLHDESFVDVTLAVEGHLLKAHKMVLSACSPYFQSLFTGHPDRHPIVILKDVPYADMSSLLDFMYRGEVSVDQDRLTAFLRVAESLRIKGLTEVNEEKCDLPGITSSLLRDQSRVGQTPPPNLHRINPANQHHQQQIAQKRYHSLSTHPLLGSALTAPKRKRGRPRKLSGSSDTPMDSSSATDHQNLSGSELVQGSPEMMEMKMGLDFQSDMHGNSGGSSASIASNGSPDRNNRKDEPTENGTDDPMNSLVIKMEAPESLPSTSAHIKDEEFARPQSRQGNESYKQGEYHSDDKVLGLLTPERHSSRDSSPRPGTASTPNTPSTPTPAINCINLTTGNSTTLISAANQGTPRFTHITLGQHNTPVSTAGGTPGGAPGAMSAPTGRPIQKRRMRRRATSQSQDPAEQLTEMSVRGLNLFRYASVSDGVYQCTECAKDSVQKTFKNKYSFQRHAFLYHEGHQRKVFPCPVCGKEFSRPDKMKNHMKTVHDCFMPKECNMPFSFFMPP